MVEYEWIGFAVVTSIVFLLSAVVYKSNLPPSLKLVFLLALWLRVAGTLARYFVLYDFYGGKGDVIRYFTLGIRYADNILSLDFNFLTDNSVWERGQWWGTQFIHFLSGWVIALTGPTMRGSGLVFSLLSFLGLVGFVAAFQRAFPVTTSTKYATWVLLFPSLWYWPSIIGKEPVILLGLGIAVLGYVGFQQRINWFFLIGGVFLIFCVRPQVAAVFITALILVHWLTRDQAWTPARVFQGFVIVSLGLWASHLAMIYIDAGGFDVEGVAAYLDQRADVDRVHGRSGIQAPGFSLLGGPIALVNIFFRPFPWEAHNMQAFFAAGEIWLFWTIVWIRRRDLVSALKSWRVHRFVCLAVVFVLLYAVTLGMIADNLSILSRQRIFLFPFLFLLLEAFPARRRRYAEYRSRQVPVGAAGY